MLDTLSLFKQAMCNSGLPIEKTPIADGHIHRFGLQEDRNKPCWYILYPDIIPHGAFGCWKRGLSKTWWGGIERDRYSEPQKQQLQEKMQEIQEQKRQCHQQIVSLQTKAQKIAQSIWNKSQPCSSYSSHPYLSRKQVKPFGVRTYKGLLLIPLCDHHGVICSLQFISKDGEKRFLKHGIMQGCYHQIGQMTDMKETLYIVEGYATGATVHVATNCSVIITFTAHNLLPVSKIIREKYPTASLVICADNDQWTENNPGVRKATEAAKMTHSKLVIPQFKTLTGNPTDFNDLMQQEGIEAVRTQIEKAQEIQEIKEVEEIKKVKDIPVVQDIQSIQAIQAIQSSKLFDKNEMEELLQYLAGLSPLEYDQIREQTAKDFNVRTRILDKEVQKYQQELVDKEDKKDQPEWEQEIEPYSKEVSGEALANELFHLFKQHIILTETDATTLTLWVMGTYCFDAFRIYPKLLIHSPEKRCGKTTLLELLSSLVHKALLASNITPSAIFRAIEAWKPSLLIDEGDTFLNANEELRGIINSGHTKRTAYVIRTESNHNHQLLPKTYKTWSPMAISMIKKPPDTILDRSIAITLKRKLPTEIIRKLDINGYTTFKTLRQKLKRWAIDSFERLKQIQPKMPPLQNDRATDNWIPLFTIAEILSETWVDHAIKAVQQLTASNQNQEDSTAIVLLTDIQQIFQERQKKQIEQKEQKAQADKIHTDELIQALIALEERSWREWRNNHPMTQCTLANLLKPFGIRSHQIWSNQGNKHGYHLEDFKEVFARYLLPL